MRKVLFVDDDKNLLDALARGLKGVSSFQATFATSGQDALALLEGNTFDVIVTDMKMSGMDGVALLVKIKEKHPSLVRIVPSGHAEFESGLRALAISHQYLQKPCPTEKLVEVIHRTCHLQALLVDDTVRKLVGQIGRLPALPRTYGELSRALAADAPFSTVKGIVEKDPAVCAKILQVVNSAVLGLPRRVANVQNAISCLGTNMLRNVVLSTEVFSGPAPAGRKVIDALQAHSMLTASIARQMMAGTHLADDAFTAGLLHDLGRLIIVNQMPKVSADVEAAVKKGGTPTYRAEEQVLRTSHAEIGGYLLGLWGLPYPVVEAVANHHHPERIAAPRFDLLAVVHIAEALANEVGPGAAEKGAAVDTIYLEELGVTNKLDGWRAMAEVQAEAVAAIGAA